MQGLCQNKPWGWHLGSSSVRFRCRKPQQQEMCPFGADQVALDISPFHQWWHRFQQNQLSLLLSLQLQLCFVLLWNLQLKIQQTFVYCSWNIHFFAIFHRKSPVDVFVKWMMVVLGLFEVPRYFPRCWMLSISSGIFCCESGTTAQQIQTTFASISSGLLSGMPWSLTFVCRTFHWSF